MKAAIRALLDVMNKLLKLGGNPEDLPGKVKVSKKILIDSAQTINDAVKELEKPKKPKKKGGKK